MGAQVRAEWSEDRRRLGLILDRPRGNVVTTAMMEALREAVIGLDQHPDLKLITIEGAGDHFSYGASVEEHVPSRVAHVLTGLRELILTLLEAPAPTAAIVRGRCLGGGFEIVLACDFVFAAEDAALGVPEIALGVFPPVAAALLPVKIGASRAAHAVLTGEALAAGWWAEAGLLEAVRPASALAETVTRWYETHLASRSAAALRHAVLAARKAAREAVDTRLPALEDLYLHRLMRTADAVEGTAAFLEKRAPHWRNQ